MPRSAAHGGDPVPVGKRRGVFDPWRQEDAPPARTEEIGPATDADDDAPSPETCVLFRGKRAGANVWIESAGDRARVNAIALARLLEAIDLVPAEVLAHHGLAREMSSGTGSASFGMGSRRFYLTEKGDQLGASRVVDAIALALVEAGTQDKRMQSRLEELRIVPFLM